MIGGVLTQGDSVVEDADAVSCIVGGSLDCLVPAVDAFGGLCFGDGDVGVIFDEDGDEAAVVGLERVKHEAEL